MTLRLPLLLLAASLLAGPARAADRPAQAPPDPEAPGLSSSDRLSALIDRVKWEQARLTSLEADFVQERSSEFLAKPETSHGSFSYVAPERVRWEYLDPKPISMVIQGDEMVTWFRDVGRAEKVKVGRVSAQVFKYLNATGSLETLMSYFAVTFRTPAPGEPYQLELQPRYPRIAKRLAGMTLWVDRQLYLPVRVRYVEPNGDTTDYRFAKLRPNGAIPAERFELHLPKDVPVKVVDLDKGRISAP